MSELLTDAVETIKNAILGTPNAQLVQPPYLESLLAIAENLLATADHPGAVQLATEDEAATGEATDRAVTPAGVAAALIAAEGVLPATDAVAGVVELATDAETITGTDDTLAVTPAGAAAAIAANQAALLAAAPDIVYQDGAGPILIPSGGGTSYRLIVNEAGELSTEEVV
jgi:hypothetical protein